MGRYPSLHRHLPKVASLCLTAAMLFSACGDDAEPVAVPSSDTTSSSTTTATRPPTTTLPPTTTQPSPITTVPPTTEPEASDSIGAPDIERDTVWQEVFETLTASEQTCIRDAVGTDLDSVLEQRVLAEDGIGQWGGPVFSCLQPPLARFLFLAGVISGMEEEGVEVDEDQESCLEEVLAEMDMDALLSAMASEAATSDDPVQLDNALQLSAMTVGFLQCIPELDFSVEADSDPVATEEAVPVFGYCPVIDYSDQVDGIARVEVGGGVEGVLDYGGDVDVFVFGAVGGELYEIDVALGTLGDSVVEVCDAAGVALAHNDDRVGSLASRVVWRAPASGEFYVGVAGYGEGSYTLTVADTDVVDDFSDGLEGAGAVEVGGGVEGVLDYGGDVDVFVFGAVGGELYEIDVALGTLGDSVVEVYDAAGVALAHNDDRVGSLASRVVWRAPASGEFYVGVAGYGEGSYTLTVADTDVVDDFSDGLEGAGAVEVGGGVEGVLDYGGDVDVFVFGAVGGELYEIDVALGTLGDSVVEVYDAAGVALAHNDDRVGSLASRVVWRAPASGEFYVGVAGYGEGSYTLTVSVSE